MAKSSGGLKGLIQSTGKAVFAAGVLARDYGTVAARWSYRYVGGMAFALATTSMIVLMPLMFESSREVQMLENERMQVKDLKNRGFADRQLQELGYCEAALHTPSVALAK